jgi:hypothetical protein
MKNTIFSSSLLWMAGIAAILAGVFIISFAVIGTSNKLFFYFEVLEGGSVVPWIQNVQASPSVARFIMALPVLGFSCFLLVAIVLYQYIQETSWQKNLSMAAYLIGVPVTILMWTLQLSLMNYVLLNYGKSPEMNVQVEGLASYILYFFHAINEVFGPLFIIVLGTAMMAWAALKAGVLPKWLCYWAMACGVLLLLSFISVINPAFRILSFAAPLHMLWFIVLGIVLWRRATAKN